MKPYYYIRHISTGTIEDFKSESISDALYLSETMAQEYPGQAFEILQCVGISQVSAAKTFWTDGFLLEKEAEK
jgi:hypothetical protein